MLLARHIRAQAAWADWDEDAFWHQDDFPYPALQELADARGKGLSCFAVSTIRDPKLSRIAAALCAKGQGEVGDMQFRFIDTENIRELNLSIAQTDGDTTDKELNKSHFEIKGLTGPTAIQLARLMRDRVRVVKEADIVEQIVIGLRKGYWKTDNVNKGKLQKALARKFCHQNEARAPKPAS